jgi:hypothetical protein
MPATALVIALSCRGRVRQSPLKQFSGAEVLSKNKKMWELHPPSHHQGFFLYLHIRCLQSEERAKEKRVAAKMSRRKQVTNGFCSISKKIQTLEV